MFPGNTVNKKRTRGLHTLSHRYVYDVICCRKGRGPAPRTIWFIACSVCTVERPFIFLCPADAYADGAD